MDLQEEMLHSTIDICYYDGIEYRALSIFMYSPIFILCMLMFLLTSNKNTGFMLRITAYYAILYFYLDRSQRETNFQRPLLNTCDQSSAIPDPIVVTTISLSTLVISYLIRFRTRPSLIRTCICFITILGYIFNIWFNESMHGLQIVINIFISEFCAILIWIVSTTIEPLKEVL